MWWNKGLPFSLQAVFDAHASLFPSCAACVFDCERAHFAVCGMARRSVDGNVPVDEHTVFDLASLTKALAAAPAVFRLWQEGRLRLEDAPVHGLENACPELAAHLEHVTIAQLLNHSAGLPAYAPFFETASSVGDMLERLGQIRPEAAPGERFLYSDIGYMILGLHLSHVTGMDWTVWAKDRLFSGMGFSFWGPPDGAAWADNREPNVSVRGVHDENARLLAPYCAHAGLFGSLRDVAEWGQRLCRIWRGEEQEPLKPGTVRRMWAPLSSQDPFTCGFDRPSAAGFTTAGETVDRQAVVGHLGFSGTAFWVHPERCRGGVLLTNRVSLGRHARMEELRRFRAEFFAAVWDAAI